MARPQRQTRRGIALMDVILGGVMLGIGLTVVIITAGIDLSVGAVLALSAVVATSLAQLPEATNLMYPGLDLPVLLAVAAGLGVGALCGAINGSLVAFFRLAPFIATLGMMTAARGLALIYSGGRPISRLEPDYNWFGQGEILGIPVVDHLIVTRGGFYSFKLDSASFKGSRHPSDTVLKLVRGGLGDRSKKPSSSGKSKPKAKKPAPEVRN